MSFKLVYIDGPKKDIASYMVEHHGNGCTNPTTYIDDSIAILGLIDKHTKQK
jgi:hypothetical protein